MESAVLRQCLVLFIFISLSVGNSFALTKYGPFPPVVTGKYVDDEDAFFLNQKQESSPPLFNELWSSLPRSLRSNMEPISPLTQFGPSLEDSKTSENDMVLPQRSELPSRLKKLRTNNHKTTTQDDKKSEKKKKLEISWRDCSAKNVQVHLDSNVKLRCEMWAPIGSTVTWLKDEMPIRTQHHGNITFVNPVQPSDVIQTNDVETNDVESNGRKTYEFHLKTLYYLDCITTDDEGLYKLQVLTPKGKLYTRSFNVKTLGRSRRYSIMYCKYFNVYSQQFDPRIIEFSKTIIGKIGEELILPCRPKEFQSVAVNWNKLDRKITPDNYSITDEGDLRIHELSKDDRGMFVCEVFHDVSEVTYDQITTFVRVRD